MIYAWGVGGCCVSWQEVGRREVDHSERWESWKPVAEFPRGSTWTVSSGRVSLRGPRFPAPTQQREATHQLHTQVSQGVNLDSLLGHGLSWGALDFRLPPSRERGYIPSSLSLFGLFYKYLLSTSLPPRPPGSSPALASGLRTGLGAKPGSAPDLTGQSLVGRHTANRK